MGANGIDSSLDQPPGLRQQRAFVGSPADADELPVEELFDTKGAELTAEARPLGAAERQFWRIKANPVDEDHARVEGVRDTQCLRLIGREDIGAKTVRSVIGNANRVGLSRWDHCRYSDSASASVGNLPAK